MQRPSIDDCNSDLELLSSLWFAVVFNINPKRQRVDEAAPRLRLGLPEIEQTEARESGRL